VDSIIFLVTSHYALLNTILNLVEAVLYQVTAVCFLYYGGKIIFHISKFFPIQTKSKDVKAREVGFVTIICTLCFTLRCVYILIGEFYQKINLSYIFVVLYFLLVEVVPVMILFVIYRNLPPANKNQNDSQQLSSDDR